MMEWINVNKFLPGKKARYVIVRCVDKSLDNLYLTALYDHRMGLWDFICMDYEFIQTLKVTHWIYPDDVNLLVNDIEAIEEKSK